jgi:hypothetical protein
VEDLDPLLGDLRPSDQGTVTGERLPEREKRDAAHSMP